MQSFMAGSRLGYGLLAKLANGQRANLDLSKRGADLSRGPQALSKLPAAAWSNTWPAPAATLDLDFANNRGFVRGSGQGGAMDAVTFTRASSGNWVDNTGVLRTGAGTFTGTANATAANINTNPQNFDNAAWTKVAATITPNAIAAPDGTLTGAFLLPSTASSTHYLQQTSVIAVTTYTASVYAKAGGYNFVFIGEANSATNQYAYFNLATGTVGNTNNVISTSITDVGNGWYRCVATWSGGSASARGQYIACDQSNGSVGSWTGNGTSGIYIWGAQLEVGSSATTYYPTNINAPRFDWASTTSSVQAISPYTATTTTTAPNNLLLYSQDYTQTSWTKGNTTITSTNNAAPDGTNTATLFTQTNTNSATSVYQSYSASGYNVTVSFHVKRGNTDWLRLDLYTSSTVGYLVWFNTATGQFGSTLLSGGTPINTQATVVALANGWYRVSLTAGLVGSGAIVGAQAVNADNSSTRVNTGTYLMWGAQVEANATNTPLVANSTCNGLLIEESRTNRILWCRDGLNGGTAVGTNTLTYSEQFDNAAWSKINVNVTQNSTTDPLGGSTADTLTASATSSTVYVRQGPYSVASTYTYSVYVKAGNISWAAITFNSFAGQFSTVFVNLSTGAIGTTANTTYSAPIVSVTNAGSGWYRVAITANITNTTANAAIVLASADNNLSVNSGDYIYAWGAQSIPGATLTDYQITAAAGVFGWSKSNVTVAKTATGIDGVANAATTITASANNAVLIQPISLASGSRTGSVYLKRITGTGNVQVTLDGSTWSTVDLSNGLWNRIVLSGTVTNPCVGVLLATNGDAVAMDYAQVEDGSFVTSPILTTSATATRATEQFTLPTATWLEPSQGTFLNSCVGLGYTTANFSVLFVGAAGNNIIVDRTGSAARFRPTITISGVELSNNGNYGLLSTPYPYTITCAFSRAKFDPLINGLNASGNQVEATFNLVTSPLPLDTLTCNSSRTRYVERLIYTPKILSFSAAVNYAGAV